MKGIYTTLIVGFCSVVLSVELYSQTLQAGAASVDITPTLGTLINGDFVSHYATTVHDPLHAKAIVLKRGNKTVAIVVVDICEMLKDFLDGTKLEIQKATGISSNDILISSTHIHSGGSVESDLLAAADLPYRKKLPGLIVQSVLLAKQRLQEAEIAFGSVPVPEHVRVRRYLVRDDYEAINPVTGQRDKIKTNPGGALPGQVIEMASVPDPDLSFLSIRSLEKKWIAVLGNYSMHYVGDWPSGTLTADYFGVFSNEIKKLLHADDDFVGILSNGTSGDANIRIFLGVDPYPSEDFSKSAVIGADLAKKFHEVLPQVKWQKDAELKSAYKEIRFKVRKPSAKELDSARAIVQKIDFEKIISASGDGFLKELYAFEQTMLSEYPDSLSQPVQAIRIGNGIIGALPGEMFSETGLWLKKNKTSTHYFTIGLANSYPGYIPPAHEIQRGGYETWRCRTSCLEERAEDVLRANLKTIADKLLIK